MSGLLTVLLSWLMAYVIAKLTVWNEQDKKK